MQKEKEEQKENKLKFENLLADTSAFLVAHYDMSPKDAVGIVMLSELTESLGKQKDNALSDMTPEKLSSLVLGEGE